jgi:hypothetical protein
MSTLSIKAKEFVRDVKSAMDDDGLMIKYGLTLNSFRDCSSSSLTWTCFLKIRSLCVHSSRRARLPGRFLMFRRLRKEIR